METLRRLRAWVRRPRTQLFASAGIAALLVSLVLGLTFGLGVGESEGYFSSTSPAQRISQSASQHVDPPATPTEPHSDPAGPSLQPPAIVLYTFSGTFGSNTELDTSAFSVAQPWYATWSCTGQDVYGTCTVRIVETEADGSENDVYLSDILQSDGSVSTTPITLPGRFTIAAYGHGVPSDTFNITIYPAAD